MWLLLEEWSKHKSWTLLTAVSSFYWCFPLLMTFHHEIKRNESGIANFELVLSLDSAGHRQ